MKWIEGDIFVFFLTTERRVAQRSLVPPVLTPVAQRMRLLLAIICVPSPFRTASQYRANISLCLCSSSWLVEKETSSKYHSLFNACLTSWVFWRVWVGQVSLFLMIFLKFGNNCAKYRALIKKGKTWGFSHSGNFFSA